MRDCATFKCRCNGRNQSSGLLYRLRLEGECVGVHRDRRLQDNLGVLGLQLRARGDIGRCDSRDSKSNFGDYGTMCQSGVSLCTDGDDLCDLDNRCRTLA